MPVRAHGRSGASYPRDKPSPPVVCIFALLAVEAVRGGRYYRYWVETAKPQTMSPRPPSRYQLDGAEGRRLM